MNLWVIVFAIGAAQAALLALALWRRPANQHANRLLAAWLAIIGVDLATKAAFLAAPGPGLFPAYRFVALFPFLYGSLFYLYVRALTTARGFALRDAVHLAGYVFVLSVAMLQLAHRPAGEWPQPAWWYDPLLFAYSLSYVVAALVQVQRYRRRLRQRRSDADRMSLRWVVTLAIAQIIIWCIAGVQELIRIPHVDYYLIYGAVAAWVCVVGWFSLGQPPVVDEPLEAGGESIVDGVSDDAEGSDEASDDDARFPAVEARLSQLMVGEALYREPALTIGQVAKRSGYPEYLVSAVINRRLGGNFWDYINRQRIEAARACLADRDDSRTILDIAYACGFTSKSTFNAAFKRQVGRTPSAHRQQHSGASTGA